MSWSIALGDVDSALGTSRFRSRIRFMASDFAMFARSMAISFALGSLGFCMRIGSA